MARVARIGCLIYLCGTLYTISLIHLIDCRLGWDVNLQLEAITAITPISLHSELLSQEQVCSRLSFSKALGQDSEDNCLAFYKTTGYTMIYWIKFSDLAIWFNNVYWSTIMDLRCQIVEIEKFTYINICWLAKKSLYILVFLETFLHSLYSWKHFLCKESYGTLSVVYRTVQGSTKSLYSLQYSSKLLECLYYCCKAVVCRGSHFMIDSMKGTV